MLFNCKGKDSRFCAVRDNPHYSDIQRECLRLWERFEAPLADKKFKEQFSINFDAGFWEMYLGNHFLERYNGAVTSEDKGPDFHVRVGNQTIFVEATVASRGTTEDAIPDITTFREGDDPLVPFKECILRITSSLKNKASANGAKKKAEDGPYVIAINLPYKEAWLCTNPPMAAQATLGVKGHGVEFNELEARTIYGYNPSIRRVPEPKASISTMGFLGDEYSHISALIVASVSPFSSSYSKPSLELLRNPKASQPLEHGLVGIGREYWVESGVLKELSYDD